ncbi:hypothetical protein GH741_05480 [Aquibacillus halophilus]|uniref:YesK-like protein n=1 Tax=Aquibacillus halophilus TaxID=930132 RepID=A0A6A8DC65_9BACI|nr:hypothetical protein [Aquibacillus halophilus]MRH42126.1 hypothetical protein [Aquibacillus halophilus]
MNLDSGVAIFLIYVFPSLLFGLGLFLIARFYSKRRKLIYPLITANTGIVLYYLAMLMSGWMILILILAAIMLLVVGWLTFVIMHLTSRAKN